MRRLISRLSISAIGLLWLSTLAWGVLRLMDYEYTPGQVRSSPHWWPAESALQPDVQRGTVVLFCHPNCGCTRTTIEKLRASMELCPTPPSLRVVLTSVQEPGEVSANRSLVEEIAGAQVWIDAAGNEVRRFRAMTSGTVLFYDATGTLRFSGGLTQGRGKQAFNSYEEAFQRAVISPRYPLVIAPVFGCSLVTKDAN